MPYTCHTARNYGRWKSYTSLKRVTLYLRRPIRDNRGTASRNKTIVARMNDSIAIDRAMEIRIFRGYLYRIQCGGKRKDAAFYLSNRSRDENFTQRTTSIKCMVT